MSERNVDVAVVGAGAFGLSTALRLARVGLSVRVFDQSVEGRPNASTIAAGMLAPVSETLAEGGDHAYLQRLLKARDDWPPFAASVAGLVLDRTGTDLLASDGAALDAIIAQLSGLGIEPLRLEPPRTGLHLADDWRLDAVVAMTALRAALAGLRVSVEVGAVTVRDDKEPATGSLLFGDEPLAAGLVVIAAGYGAHHLSAAAPELDSLIPIKGQLVTFAPGVLEGPTLREAGLYVAPQGSGARAGATMEAGRDDAEVEPAVIDRLHRGALALQPALREVAHRGEAGVRAATPDGWPLVGPSVTPGVFLATGGRRNGWLLAPLVSQMIEGEITGAAPHSLAQAFHPGRFTR